MNVVSKVEPVYYTVTLAPAEAQRLYNDIYRITNDAGIATARDRGDKFVTLFALYDSLFSCGVDGSGPQ